VLKIENEADGFVIKTPPVPKVVYTEALPKLNEPSGNIISPALKFIVPVKLPKFKPDVAIVKFPLKSNVPVYPVNVKVAQVAPAAGTVTLPEDELSMAVSAAPGIPAGDHVVLTFQAPPAATAV
jgi:hypothetical protein